MAFPDKEDSIWQYDEKTEEWYLHRFYQTQPDLNITNARVLPLAAAGPRDSRRLA